MPSEAVRLFRIQRVGDVLVAVGSIGVLVFGIWLAIDVDGYEVWDGWVIAALVLWLVMGALGSRTGKLYNAARDRALALSQGRHGRAERRVARARPGPPRALAPRGPASSRSSFSSST